MARQLEHALPGALEAERPVTCDYCGQPANGKGPVTKDETGSQFHAECRRKFFEERRPR